MVTTRSASRKASASAAIAFPASGGFPASGAVPASGTRSKSRKSSTSAASTSAASASSALGTSPAWGTSPPVTAASPPPTTGKHRIDDAPDEDTHWKKRKPTPRGAKKNQPQTIEESMRNRFAAGGFYRSSDVMDTFRATAESSKVQERAADETADKKSVEGESAVEANGREGSTPSSILEKGIIYFFIRGRVNINEPSSVNEVARSYIILRPIEKNAKLGAGTIGDAGNSRLCAIPKKVLPTSGRERWIAFVEKAGVSFKDLKEEFLKSSDYETKTAGARHTPAATPVAEGIYAITSTGRESHLAYILTIPEKLGEVQHEMGLREKGSFVISTKNPQYPGPANARLPKGADYPEELQKEFRSLRWVPTQPKHLDYVNTQFLLIGESSGIEKAAEPQKKGKGKGKVEPLEEMEELEEEEEKRMKSLGKDDSDRIFADLQAHMKDHPKLQTTF
ncbi:hypothetical protein QBC46DRAFT_285174 [Diplogelasinospora grovesii]|uniref:BTB domain transcription factor n=1 Tax=Diplogelasinospora grovesii TaxID=303347 RepID=A0AAN6NBH8_9PEZI|nr:hypothetical protein QBC46DRAFT_285174 [Diplogelasinospora grovesii]